MTYTKTMHPVEMKRGQLLSITVDTGVHPPIVTVTEDMPPLIPSNRLPDPDPTYEKDLREREWAEAFRKSLEYR